MKENENKTQNSKGVKALKTVINTIINILIVIVLITSIVIAALALTSKSSGISTIFGYTIQPIESDSMKGGSPDGYKGGDFEKGDLMIAKATDFDINAEYKVGDIVTYSRLEADATKTLIVHRIVDVVKDEDGYLRYQTWGDNRDMDTIPDQTDPAYYLRADQIGSVFYSDSFQGTILKGVGGVLDYLRSQQGFFLVVLLPMILFFMYELIRVILNLSDYRKAKADEEKQNAVDAAVAEALAQKESDASAESDISPENMTPEQMAKFKEFLEAQKKQETDQSVGNAD